MNHIITLPERIFTYPTTEQERRAAIQKKIGTAVLQGWEFAGPRGSRTSDPVKIRVSVRVAV